MIPAGGNMSRNKVLIKNILSSQYFAVLNSSLNGQPHSNLIAFAVSDDLKSLVFSTKRATQKYKNIKEHNNVSVLIDDRTNQHSDISQATAITLIGSAREQETMDEGLKRLLLGRHPELQTFIDDSATALILVQAQQYIIAGFDRAERIQAEDL
jgi:heme iron utilization protein